MPTTIRCSACAKEFRAPSQFPATCPNCGKVFGPVRLAPSAGDESPRFMPRVYTTRPDALAIEPTRAPTGGRAELAGAKLDAKRGETSAAIAWASFGGGLVAVAIIIGAIVNSSGKSPQSEPRSQSGAELLQDRVNELPEREVVAIEPALPPVAGPDGKLSAEDLYAWASPSVVTMYVRARDGVRQGSAFRIDDSYMTRRDPRYGSGRFKLPSGATGTFAYFVTNQHVVKNATGGQIISGQAAPLPYLRAIVTENELFDLAVVQVVYVGNVAPPPPLPLASEDPRIASKVYAIGAPRDLDKTITSGIISQIRPGHVNEHWLQVDVPVSHGSSGGPILSEAGCVVGVVARGRVDGQNLNFGPSCTMLRWLLNSPFVQRTIVP